MQVVMTALGEQRDGLQRSNRTFAFYAAPTGVEIALSKCDHLERKWGRQTGAPQSPLRLMTSEYVAKHPVVLKFVTIKSTFGKARMMSNIYVRLNDDESRIQLTGFDGFGELVFNGVVLRDRGFVNNEKLDKTKKSTNLLEKHHGYRVLAGPSKISTGVEGTRNIFW